LKESEHKRKNLLKAVTDSCAVLKINKQTDHSQNQLSTPKLVRKCLIESGYSHIKGHLENDNLRDEYDALYADIPKSIPFARIALQKYPDAINFWLGKIQRILVLYQI